MALALAETLVAPAAAVAWGLATTGFLLLLLLLCSFFHRPSRSFSTQKIKPSPGLVRGLRLARLGSCDGGAALPGGTPSPGEPQQQANGPAVSGALDNPAVGVPERTPHPNSPSESPQRTPEFLRHRQLPVLPGEAGTAGGDPAPDAEGPIYESIHYKSRTLKKPRDASSAPEDSPSLPTRDETTDQEEPDGTGSSSPIYAQVCKRPRAPQPQQPHSPPEPREETPPSLPEKRFDVP